MLGLAMGRIGISYDDFCRLTFAEFDAVCAAWSKGQEERERGEWERMRIHAAVTLQPHLRKGQRLTPQRLLPLPWDGGSKRKGRKAAPPMGAAERRERMEMMKEKLKNI